MPSEQHSGLERRFRGPGWSKGSQLPVHEWKAIPILVANFRLTTAQVSLRPEDLCAGGTARLLQSEKKSQVVMPSASRARHLQGQMGAYLGHKHLPGAGQEGGSS